jgi:hypothetical protein
MADLGTLRTILLNKHLSDADRQEVLRELARQDPGTRSEVLARAFQDVLRKPEANSELISSLVELLATDPEPSATEVMLDMLPLMAHAGADHRGGNIPRDDRSYFYEALITRRREEDRRVWAQRLPQLDADALVDIMADPAARPLRKSIDVLGLVNKLPRPERRRALFALLFTGGPGTGLKALGMMLGGG